MKRSRRTAGPEPTPPPHSPKSSVVSPGLPTLTKLRELLQIEDGWCHREERSFTWLPHRFCQTVSAEAPVDDDGETIVRTRARTAVLRDVTPGDAVFTRIAEWNRQANLSALRLDPTTGDLFLDASAWFHSGNAGWLTSFFAHAVALQAAEAHLLASTNDLPASLGSGAPDLRRPGTLPPRDAPDDMLNVIGTLYRPFSETQNDFQGPELAAAASMEPQVWTLANGDEDALTGEFPFTDCSAHPSGGVDTSLMQADTRQAHPVLGDGLLVRLTLPVSCSDTDAARIANALNQQEAEEFTRCHQLGAWCVGPLGITHVTFYPAFAHRPGLLPNLFISEAIRNRWVQGALPAAK